ncbi:MAG: GNAT family N-acetyltransferase [Brucellaceae bacterium]|nr:GNAT family N-acetyltransferase [Brucellaceae bacterium]
MPIEVRAAAVADADVLLAVLMRSYASNFEKLEPGALATPGYRDLLRERIAADISAYGASARVAEVSGTCAGWCGRMAGQNEIADLWVDPPYQGQGVGTALLARALEDIRGDEHAVAEINTHERNTGAIRLYERTGFRIYRRGADWSQGLQRDIPKVYMRMDMAGT